MKQPDLATYKQQLMAKKELLQHASIQLKKEFIGLDDVIDRITNALISWMYFPELQYRPVIINLWGMTGIGKTSLVKRLSELIDFESHYFHFDMGDKPDSEYNIRDIFKEIYDNCNGKPIIIGLDEFQFARTIDEEHTEIEKPHLQAIWDLLDTGKFDLVGFNWRMSWFNRLIKNLSIALNQGVVVNNGLVVSNETVFQEIMDKAYKTDEESFLEQSPILDKESRYTKNVKKKKNEVKKNVYFVSEDDIATICDIMSFLFLSKHELRRQLNADGEKTLEVLTDIYNKALQPKKVDCTKALVFVMGNLDEVYSMTHNFNPDISANEFYRQSVKITITQVKNALMERFRSEQIARLGNLHIIYPSFNEHAFYAIIRLELGKIKQKIIDLYDIQTQFDASVEQLIYNEGVYPTQGTRPVFTTIYQIVHSRLGKVLYELYIEGYEADMLQFGVLSEQQDKNFAVLQVDFLKDGKSIHQLIDKHPLELGKLRHTKQNDEQAICAVHESGHAVLSVILLKTVPDSVVSVTASPDSDGFVLTRPEWNYVSKKDIINRLAVLLGGLIAERIVFGDEHITMGASSDLNTATQWITRAIYVCGMGENLAAFGNQYLSTTPSVIFDSTCESVNLEARQWLKKAECLAQQTLEKQRTLLLQISDYLSDKRCADKGEIRHFVELYAVDFDTNEIVENADCLYYRAKLKEMVKENVLLKP